MALKITQRCSERKHERLWEKTGVDNDISGKYSGCRGMKVDLIVSFASVVSKTTCASTRIGTG
jgi:hypothetical protein